MNAIKTVLAAGAVAAIFGAMPMESRAAVLSVGAASDDWGDPDIGLSGDPGDAFMRVFGLTGNPGFPIRRGAMEFNIGGITAGATITSATLFFADRGTTSTAQMQLHGYTGDGTVQTGDLADGAFLSFFDVDNSDPNRDFSIDVTAFVQALVNGSAGFAGFMLRATSEGPGNFNGADFATSEFGGAGNVPLLTVEFNAVPAPATALLLIIGLAGMGARRLLAKR